MRTRLLLLCFALCVTAPPAVAQRKGAPRRDPATVRAAVRAYREAHEAEILRELRDLLAIPNLATDSTSIRANARHLVTMLERRGVSARLLESSGGPPAVFGELVTKGATRTVVLYAHYDGQPVDSSQWASPPWTPTLRDGMLGVGGRDVPFPAAGARVPGEWRVYARSAGDDKGPIIAMMSALDALRHARIPLGTNIKFFFEGEEEAGSSHLREMLERHAALLRADLWLFADGPVHQSRRQQVVYGVRGVMGVELTAYGPSRALHSGHYGNWAPNPVVLLAGLLSSMRDADGRITIAGFMDDVDAPSPAEQTALAKVPAPDSALRADLLLAASEADNAALAERIMLPALNVRGFSGGAVGAGAANAIPTIARASIDFRLVPRQTPERIRSLVETHARAAGFHIVHQEPTPAERLAHPRVLRLEWEGGYPAQRTRMDSKEALAVHRVVEDAVGAPIIDVPTLGGSLPTYLFEQVLHAPLIVLPTVNHDNNQHASNENLRLQNLWDGIEVWAGVMVNY